MIGLVIEEMRKMDVALHSVRRQSRVADASTSPALKRLTSVTRRHAAIVEGPRMIRAMRSRAAFDSRRQRWKHLLDAGYSEGAVASGSGAKGAVHTAATSATL